jgi:tetratricopeptide (TPR) repeat protein
MKPSASPASTNKAAAAAQRARLRGLTPDQAEAVRRLKQLHGAGDHSGWVPWLLWLSAQAPEHPEVWFWQGQRCHDEGRWPEAIEAMQRVLDQRPADFEAWCLLAAAQGGLDDFAAASLSLQAAARLARGAAEWLRLSLACDAVGEHEIALQAVQAQLRLEPDSAVGLLQRARCHKLLGHPAAAAADCRRLIARGREAARAWFALVDLKTVPLAPAELAALARSAERADIAAADRRLLLFALGLALEHAGELERALQVFQRANAEVRAGQPWDRDAFWRRVAAVEAATRGPAWAPDRAAGREVIFLVGLPRSGSTLVEQVLASHPDVEGASELPTLPQLIETESRRRGRVFPDWVPEATADDWAQLGAQYLQATARWRRRKPIATDKLPDNWLYIGALRAMLPGARIVDCRRDAVETAWSCYKQLFGPGLAAYSYAFDDLAAATAACEQHVDRWAARCPDRVRVQSYEALVQDTEAQVHALLDFCGLPFDAACLSPHQTERAIRTPSALQVRQPMRAVSSVAARYGARLDPLRQAIDQARRDESADRP